MQTGSKKEVRKMSKYQPPEITFVNIKWASGQMCPHADKLREG